MNGEPMKHLTVTLAAVVVLAGCSSTPDVDWSQFSPTVKTRIDGLVENQDCDGLQDEFDNADANSHADLMVYLDNQMEEIGCY